MIRSTNSNKYTCAFQLAIEWGGSNALKIQMASILNLNLLKLYFMESFTCHLVAKHKSRQHPFGIKIEAIKSIQGAE